jgi:alkane 1-monooxygenase
MEHAVVAPEAPERTAIRPSATTRMLALHLMALVLPLATLGFVLSGPHRWYVAILWLGVVPVIEILDRRSGPALHKPAEGAAGWPFDAMLVVLTALQVANVLLAARMIQQGGILAADTLVATVTVGANSAYSAIVVAHELIHRKSRWMALLGRLLLATVLYDHFFTEHVRGHHVRVGTDEDPATSRFGQTYAEFWRRTVRGQLRSAWRIEAKRLGDEDMKWHDPRLLRSAVVHGILAEIALVAAVLVVFGPAALLVFLGQAYVAVRLLEAVNYFEHYGLRRQGRKVRPVDSWDSDSWFTLFALVGLSRHADHHAYASRPFQALRTWDESPKLPGGYVVMVLMVMFDNPRARRLLGEELQRRRLGPFAEPA